MVTVLQFAEGLSDRQVANAVRTRIDWKYALHLRLNDVGFHFSILCEFRARLICAGAERDLFDALLRHATTRGWRQRCVVAGEPIRHTFWQQFRV